MNMLLEEFNKNFTPDPGQRVAAVTWYRDVDYQLVSNDDPDLLPWAMEVPSELTDPRQLEAIRLKWFMDVDEMMFYIENKHLPVPVAGLKA